MSVPLKITVYNSIRENFKDCQWIKNDYDAAREFKQSDNNAFNLYSDDKCSTDKKESAASFIISPHATAGRNYYINIPGSQLATQNRKKTDVGKKLSFGECIIKDTCKGALNLSSCTCGGN
jgi:hypothetical protein